MKKKPDKQTRNPEKTRAKILEVAFYEIFLNGFQGVSIDQIVAKTELTKGAFFHHFPNKQALGYAHVDETLTAMVLERWIKPLESFKNPIEGVISVWKTIIDETPDENFALGCPLNNLIQEMSPLDPIFRAKLRAALEIWISGVEHEMKRAKKDGFLKKEINPRDLAEFIVMNHEGAFGMMKSLRERKVFRSFHESLKNYLRSVSNRTA